MSQPAKDTIKRRADLERAIKATKPKQTIKLDDLAALWGVSKGRFVNIRNMIPKFPDPKQGSHNSLLYPRLTALKILLAYEMRNDAVAAEKQAKVAHLLGQSGKARDTGPMLPPSELLKLDQVGANVERRMVAQRELLRATEVHRVTGKVFHLLSTRLSSLDTVVDPNGKLDAAIRADLRQTGRQLLGQMHAEMAELLGEKA